MPYIDYDTSGNITGQFACQQYSKQIFVVIPDDGKIYKYIDDELVEDAIAETKKIIQEANNIYKKKIDNITNSALIDLFQLKAGEITQSVYDTRTTAKASLYTVAKNEFYATTGLTQPTITQ